MDVIKITNIEVVGLVKEIYETRPDLKSLLSCTLSGPARRKLNASGHNLRIQYNAINLMKIKLLTKYGEKIDGKLLPILPKDGVYESPDHESKAKIYIEKMTSIMTETVDINVEFLNDEELPTLSGNYELVFTKLVNK